MAIAMKSDGKFEIEGEISQKLYEKMEVYQDIMTKWYPELKKTEIKAQKISEDKKYNISRKKISCFAGE